MSGGRVTESPASAGDSMSATQSCRRKVASTLPSLAILWTNFNSCTNEGNKDIGILFGAGSIRRQPRQVYVSSSLLLATYVAPAFLQWPWSATPAACQPP
eukprot:4748092-Amphidinium_carterae.1